MRAAANLKRTATLPNASKLAQVSAEVNRVAAFEFADPVSIRWALRRSHAAKPTLAGWVVPAPAALLAAEAVSAGRVVLT
jgi:hypothetical protein